MDLRVRRVERIEVVVHPAGDFPNARHMLFHEEHICRIDVARPNKSLRLLCTPALVGFVDQPALILHEVLKVPPGA